MRRSELLSAAGGVTVAWPRTVAAEPAGGRRTIGVLTGRFDGLESRMAAFTGGLTALGWRQGDNVDIDIRYVDGTAPDFERQASDLLKRAPDVILATSGPAVETLKRLTTVVPIVFIRTLDPVGRGLVASLTHPGGNLTGFASKLLQLLLEIAPRTRHVALVYNAPFYPRLSGIIQSQLRSIRAAAKAAGVTTVPVPIRSVDDFQRIDTLGEKPETGLYVLPSPIFSANRVALVDLAARSHLPAIYAQDRFTAAGGLLSYVDDDSVVWGPAASYVDRILRGAKPADLPVQTPTNYVLSVNLKAARAIGITVPQSILLRATEIIR